MAHVLFLQTPARKLDHVQPLRPHACPGVLSLPANPVPAARCAVGGEGGDRQPLLCLGLRATRVVDVMRWRRKVFVVFQMLVLDSNECNLILAIAWPDIKTLYPSV